MKFYIVILLLFTLLNWVYCKDLYVIKNTNNEYSASFYKSGACLREGDGYEKYECEDENDMFPKAYRECEEPLLETCVGCSCVDEINFDSKGSCYFIEYENEDCTGAKNVIIFNKLQTCIKVADNEYKLVTKIGNTIDVSLYDNPSCSFPSLESRTYQLDRCLGFAVAFCDVQSNDFINCDNIDDKCELIDDVDINEPIIVDFPLTIRNGSKIKISNLKNITFIVEGDGLIDIEGGTIYIDVTDDESFNDFIGLFENDEYDLKIIQGKYDGRFDGINVEISKEVTDCKKIDSSLIYKENESVHALFKLNKSQCGLKWWVILLICEGILIVIIIFVLFVIFNKTCRRKILPFRDRKHRV